MTKDGTALPTGTVTFLYTDIEGSTRRWERSPDATKVAVERHDAILRHAIEAQGGAVFRTMGDAFCAAFPTAPQALTASLEAQRALLAEQWSEDTGPLRVRMALHTGIGELGGGDYVGTPLNRVARLLSAGHGGQVLVSDATYDLVRDDLPPGVLLRDMGEHLLKDLQRPEHIFQLVAPGLPSEFPTLNTLDNRPNNLPLQRSPLVGREKELADIQQLLLRDDVGLLTLVGPGGIGKTRLALQVAAELIETFQDGVFFVPLASIGDPGLIAPAIAQALGIREVPGQAMVDALSTYLTGKQLLLLLDNFEQVVAAAPVVAQLLSAASAVKVLVTSREVLHLRGEQEFHVPALSLPDLKHLPSLEALSQYDAVALFIQRARLVKPDFEVTNENAPAVAEVCYRLDGLPLAIELAAARTRLLPPQAMLTRLQSRLKLLTGGSRDLPERQQTLRGAIQWSYDLLDTAEQMLFRRVSVFVGGGTLEAIEAVCNNDGLLEIDLLDGAASLVDKSLLKQEAGETEEPRIIMLDTMREYAMELLYQDEVEANEVRRSHADYYLALAKQSEEGIEGPDQKKWLDSAEAEFPNLRAAAEWLFECGDAEGSVELAAVLWGFWNTRGYYSEGRAWLDHALGMPTAEGRTAARAHALMGASMLAWRQDDYAAGHSLAEESVGIWRELVESAAAPSRGFRGLAYSLIALGMSQEGLGEYAQARALVEEGITYLRQIRDRWGLGTALIDLGIVANSQGDFEVARRAFEEGLVLFREIGEKWGLAQTLNSLGDIARIQNEPARARSLYEESLDLHRQLGIRNEIPSVIHNLGYVALAQGDIERAKSLLAEALNLQVELENKHGITECLAGLAGVAGVQKQPERAARLFGAAEALREAIGAPMWPAERVDYERNLAVSRAQLAEGAWQAAWAEGRAMSIDQAIVYAREES